MRLRDRVFIFLATGCGIGYVPLIPGTFGTLPGLPLCFLMAKIPIAVAAGAVVGIILVSMWIAGEAEKALGQKDPRKIVIDEIAGLAVALMGLPFNSVTVVLGFIVFRVFDSWKPFPLRLLERRLSGGIGVVMDDVGAGIYTNALIRMAVWLADFAG